MSEQDLIRRLARMRDERDRARDLAAALEAENARLAADLGDAMEQLVRLTAEHETTLRKLDAARAEIARAASCQVSPQ